MGGDAVVGADPVVGVDRVVEAGGSRVGSAHVKLVFLYGAPAVGKLTVARALCEQTGLPLFHNHRVVDLVASLFEFGSAPFVELREKIWLDAFRLAAQADRSLVFTFNPESTVPTGFEARVERVVAEAGGRVVLVELVCASEHLEARIEAPDRGAFGKLNSLERYRELVAAGAFDVPVPEPVLRVDTGELSPVAAAARIAEFLESQDRA